MIFNFFKANDENKPNFEPVTVTQEMKLAAKEYVETLLKKSEFDSIVAINNDVDDLVFLMIEGQDETARIIGKEGQTLLAFKQLLQGYLSRKFNQFVPVFVDCNEYFSIKIEKAQEKAKELEKRLTGDQTSIELFPMNSIERKAIHTLYKDDSKYKTYSIGEGEDRRIVLAIR